MKQAEAEKNTLSAGEIAVEVIGNYDEAILPNSAFEISTVVKLGKEYYSVVGWELRTRADGSTVMILKAG
jgi:hypothetical protein